MAGEPLKIEFQRSGGFAGMTMTSAADTAELPEDQARQIEEIVDRVDWDAAKQVGAMPTRGADRFQYDIVVTKGEQRYEVTFSEAAMPPELKPLVERMTELARKS